MRKLSTYLFLFLFSEALFAQKTEEPTVVALSFGASANFLVTVDTALESNYQPGMLNRKSTPAILATIDHKMGRRFSIGGSVSFQQVHLDVYDPSGLILAESGNVNISHIAVRGMWHWGKNERVDIYNGIKIGMLNRSISNHQSALNVNEMNKAIPVKRATLGLIPIGIRWFINDEWGLNFETSIGATTLFSVGANYRWATKVP